MEYVIILFLILIAIFFGITKPLISSKFWLVVLPITHPTYLYIVDASGIPLTTNRLAFFSCFIIFFIHFKYFFYHFKSKALYIFLFYFLILLSSLRDSYFISYLFNDFINVFIAFVLIGTLLYNSKNFEWIIEIFLLQSTLISLLVIAEFFFGFEFNYITLNESVSSQFDNYLQRDGFNRPNGIDGNPSQTAYRLAMYLPLLVWSIIKNINVKTLLYLFTTLIALVLLNTRAVFLVISLLLVLVFVYYTLINFSLKRLIIFITSSTIFILISSIYFQEIFQIFQLSIIDNIDETSFMDNVVRDRDLFITSALSKILDSIYIGYGSPFYSYMIINNAGDLPSPILYFLSAGLVGLISYFTMLLYIAKKLFFSTIKFKSYNKDIVIFCSLSVFAGFAVTFANWQESHFLVLYMIYFLITYQIDNLINYEKDK